MTKYFKVITNLLIVLSITFLIVFTSEFLVRGDAQDVIQWMKYYDIEFILTYVLVLGILIVMFCLVNHMAYGYLLTIIPICTISIINYYKIDMKGEQLSVQDFALAGELATMAGDLKIEVSVHLIWGSLLAILIFLMLKALEFTKLKKRVRTIGIGVCILTVLIMHDSLYAKEKLIKEGFLLTLVNSASLTNIEEPINYSQEAIRDILKDTKVVEALPEKKPNIIMIMSESFFHMKEIENLSLSHNPYEYFDKYCEEFTSGSIVGPKVGGYTAQTEYEVLTGNSTDYTGVNNIAYLRYIKPNIHSLVSIFKNYGYKNIAIHPYDKSFYSRDKVYEEMGFETFITRDDFEEPTYINQYISDKDVFDRIIEEYEANQDKPFFAHIVTMQNHTPYEKVDKPTIKVENQIFTDITKDTLESYATAVKETDESLHELLQYFEQVDEPTVIMFFGDHIPIMGDEVYEELNFYDKDVMSDYLRSAATPYLIWNNYGLEEKDYAHIDANYLGAILLDQIGFKQDYYFNYLYDQLDTIRAYHSNFFIDEKDEVLDHQVMSEEQKKALKNLWMLQYDKLFGKNYGGK